jgi:hypothetical protein
MESIYNLIPREVIIEEKKYSKHKVGAMASAPITGSTFGCRGTTRLPGAGVLEKKDGAFFGPNHVVPRKAPVKKDTSSGGTFTYEDKRMPGLPNRNERPVMGIKTNKNFITANAVEAILQAPRSLESKELNYLQKEDYGKVPEYLGQVREEIKRENEMIDKYVKEQMGIADEVVEEFEEMPDGERHELIRQLKAKWDSVNAKYQKITHLVQLDTAGQVRRKEQLEGALKTLETDINKLSRPGPVLLKK